MNEEFKIIRGQRIADQLDDFQLFEQSTYSELERNVLSFVPTTKKRQHAIDPIRIVSIEMLPFLGTKNLNIAGLASSDGKNYSSTIIFNKIEYEEEDLTDNVSFMAKDGEMYHIKPIQLNNHTVRVRCNCMDFYWRFAAFNAKDKSLIGRAPKAYQPKSNRGPVNPQQKPGVCKHLIALVKALKHSSIVK